MLQKDVVIPIQSQVAVGTQDTGEVRRMDQQLVSMGKAQQEYKATFSCCETFVIYFTWFLCIIPLMWPFIPKTVKEVE